MGYETWLMVFLFCLFFYNIGIFTKLEQNKTRGMTITDHFYHFKTTHEFIVLIILHVASTVQ